MVKNDDIIWFLSLTGVRISKKMENISYKEEKDFARQLI